MKIAIVSPIMIEVPPKTYGGTQNMVYELAMGLAERNYQITIFCSRGSKVVHPNIRMVESSPYPTIDKPGENRYWEARQLLSVLARQNEFDIIHLFYEPIVCEFDTDGHKLDYLSFFKTPLISSFRNLTSIDEHIEFYSKNAERLGGITKIFNSEKQKSFLSFLDNSHVIYNGLDLSRFPFLVDKENYLFFLGRFNPGKGINEAIEVANKSGNRLIIAAKLCHDEEEYFHKFIEPQIDGKQIVYFGEADFKQKTELLAKAKATLFPIDWEEPFSNVVCESLACGTPVVAFRKGSIPEIIKHGYNGYIADNINDMIASVKDLSKIDPLNCRKTIEDNFNRDKMIDAHEKIYKNLVN